MNYIPSNELTKSYFNELKLEVINNISTMSYLTVDYADSIYGLQKLSNIKNELIKLKFIYSYYLSAITYFAKSSDLSTWFELWKDQMNRRSTPYHNYNHIHQIFMLHNYSVHDYELSPEQILALLFHDYIYDPKAKDNEEKSASAATEHLKLIGIYDRRSNRFNGSIYDNIQRLILATKHNHVPDKSDTDTNIVIEYDLSILGSPSKDFQDYEEAIREEYNMYDDDDYNVGRNKFMKKFAILAKHNELFTTNELKHLNTQAAINLDKYL